MPRAVFLSPAAARDLQYVRAWYSHPEPGRGHGLRVARIVNAIDELAERPVNFPKGVWPGTRTRFVEGHRIVYRVENDTDDNATAGDVEIIRIWCPRQNRPARL